MSKRKKNPRSIQVPAGEKVARNQATPESTNDQYPIWVMNQIDFEGPWCPLQEHKKADGRAYLLEVISKLKLLSNSTWSEILQNKKKQHAVPVHKLVSQAQRRLIELRLDDEDTLFRFRLTGTERLWGIRRGAAFHLLWWDPEHKICPSQLKHT